jgi:ectoine hydroxylase-related dioxygenase (phytanoyl-CoA dioxygenase family)
VKNSPKVVLSPEELLNCRERGYLAIEGLISAEEIERLKAETTRFCRGAYSVPGVVSLPENASDEEALSKYLCIHMAHKVSPIMEEFVRHQKIASVLSQLIGPNVKCMQSMLFIKPPGFPGQAYHQDERYIPTEDRSLTGAWIAIDDATIENGCLWVIPGTNKGNIYPWAPHNNPEYDFADEAQGIPREREIPVEVKAGAVVFFNGFLLHSSHKNRSKIYRRVLVNHYMSAESILHWGEHEDYRDVIIVAGTDPHAEKGYADIARPHLRTFQREPLEQG